jgi:hypothetical protein
MPSGMRRSVSAEPSRPSCSPAPRRTNGHPVPTGGAPGVLEDVRFLSEAALTARRVLGVCSTRPGRSRATRCASPASSSRRAPARRAGIRSSAGRTASSASPTMRAFAAPALIGSSVPALHWDVRDGGRRERLRGSGLGPHPPQSESGGRKLTRGPADATGSHAQPGRRLRTSEGGQAALAGQLATYAADPPRRSPGAGGGAPMLTRASLISARLPRHGRVAYHDTFRG